MIEPLLVVFLLAQTRLTSFASRLGFVIVTGMLASIATNVSYWNWYGFPASYTASYMTTGVVGFVFVGLVAATDAGYASMEELLVPRDLPESERARWLAQVHRATAKHPPANACTAVSGPG